MIWLRIRNTAVQCTRVVVYICFTSIRKFGSIWINPSSSGVPSSSSKYKARGKGFNNQLYPLLTEHRNQLYPLFNKHRNQINIHIYPLFSKQTIRNQLLFWTNNWADKKILFYATWSTLKYLSVEYYREPTPNDDFWKVGGKNEEWNKWSRFFSLT